MTLKERRILKKAKQKKRERRKAMVRGVGKILSPFGVVLKILAAVTGVLFIVYFWNLDQKVLGWSYVQVNKIFDRKKTDIKF